MGTMKSHMVLAVMILSCCSWCFLFSVAEGRYRGVDGGVRYIGYKSTYNDGGSPVAPIFNNLKRYEVCAQWGDYCVPESKVKFANCCSSLRCACGTFLWNPGKCQCKRPSIFGR